MSTCPLLCPAFLHARTYARTRPARVREAVRPDLRLRVILQICELAGWHDVAALLRALPASNEDFVFF